MITRKFVLLLIDDVVFVGVGGVGGGGEDDECPAKSLIIDATSFILQLWVAIKYQAEYQL